MATLCDVSLLIAENAGHLERARFLFAKDMRRFVENVLEEAQRTPADQWVSGRVKVDLPTVVETESKAATGLTSQFALARVVLRFKREAKFVMVAEVPCGIEFDETANAFTWQVSLSPVAKYWRLDDVVWREWLSAKMSLPAAEHKQRANEVRFVSRPVTKDLSLGVAFGDVKAVLAFLLGIADPLAEAVGIDLSPAEGDSAQ